jgi:hypothetical protein
MKKLILILLLLILPAALAMEKQYEIEVTNNRGDISITRMIVIAGLADRDYSQGDIKIELVFGETQLEARLDLPLLRETRIYGLEGEDYLFEEVNISKTTIYLPYVEDLQEVHVYQDEKLIGKESAESDVLTENQVEETKKLFKWLYVIGLVVFFMILIIIITFIFVRRQ